jgi:hypothetical protein
MNNSKRGRSLLHRVTDRLQLGPQASIPSQTEVHDGVTPDRAPARFWTGRLGLRLGSLSSRHEIGASLTIFPNLIAAQTNYGTLATVTENVVDG